MSFKKKTFEEIYETMAADTRQRIPDITDYQEGGIIRSLYESFSIEIASLYEQMDMIYKSAFIDTASGNDLDKVVAILGIKRNEPDYASGEVTFYRDSGVNETAIIPIGTLITTEEDETKTPTKKAYLTIEEGVIEAGEDSVDVRVQAQSPGKEMTAQASAIIIMPLPVSGIKSVVNKEAVRFLGKERETDKELRQRAKKILVASGRASVSSIETALLGKPGVKEAKVREDAESLGKGVVEVYINGLNDKNASELRECIDSVRAAGIYAIMKPAVAVYLNMDLMIELDSQITGDEITEVENKVQTSVIDFIDSLKMGDPLIISQLTKQILSTNGVKELKDFAMTLCKEDISYPTGTLTLCINADGKVNISPHVYGYAQITPHAIGQVLLEVLRYSSGTVQITLESDGPADLAKDTVLTTLSGKEFKLKSGISFANTKESKTAEIIAANPGKSEEIKTDEKWEKINGYPSVFSISNSSSILLQDFAGAKIGKETVIKTSDNIEFKTVSDIEFTKTEEKKIIKIKAIMPGQDSILEKETDWTHLSIQDNVFSISNQEDVYLPQTKSKAVVPKGTEIFTDSGTKFITVSDIDFAEEDIFKNAEISADKSGKELETKAESNWKKFDIEKNTFSVSNYNALKLPQTVSDIIIPKDTKIKSASGKQFLLKEEITISKSDLEKEVSIKAVETGLASELAADSSWEKLIISGIYFSIANLEPISILKTDSSVSIPRLTSVKTSDGREFLVDEDAVFSKNDDSIDIKVRSLNTGETGELYRVGSSWQQLTAGGVNLSVYNKDMILLERLQIKSSEKKITTDLMEKFSPGQIRAAARKNPLNINVQIKILDSALDIKVKNQEIKAAVQEFFKDNANKALISKSDLKDYIIKEAGSADYQLEFILYKFQSGPIMYVDKIELSFIEEPVPETIFIYKDRLELTTGQGILKLTFSMTTADSEKAEAIAAVRLAIEQYLEELKPEQDIDLEEILEKAKIQDEVLGAKLNWDLCQLVKITPMGQKLIENRNKDRIVSVDAFEKVYLSEKAFIIE